MCGPRRSSGRGVKETFPRGIPLIRLLAAVLVPARATKAFMANTSEVAAKAAVPSGSDIERAAAFAREDFLLEGEGPEALEPGTARRQALDAALAEIEAGREDPSIEWRRSFSLLLGLERLLPEETP